MNNQSRIQNLTDWTAAQLQDAEIKLERASADASFRSYWRARTNGRNYIVMDAPPDKEDLGGWLDIAQRLRAVDLNAPQVFAEDREQGYLLISDLGTRTYLPELNEATVGTLYNDAINALFTMQKSASTAGLPAYDEQKLIAEMELFPTWFLGRHLDHTPSCGEWDWIEVTFRLLANSALAQPQAFVHRDYHSRNLLVTNVNSPGIIDFQDAVLGPITYDLVSLFRDCYIAWPEAQVDAWVEDYRGRLVHAGITTADATQFRRWFDLMGLQRHIKVLGIFCRLWYRDGKAGYLSDLPLVLRYTLSVAQRYPELAEFTAFIERVVAGRNLTEARAQ